MFQQNMVNLAELFLQNTSLFHMFMKRNGAYQTCKSLQINKLRKTDDYQHWHTSSITKIATNGSRFAKISAPDSRKCRHPADFPWEAPNWGGGHDGFGRIGMNCCIHLPICHVYLVYLEHCVSLDFCPAVKMIFWQQNISNIDVWGMLTAESLFTLASIYYAWIIRRYSDPKITKINQESCCLYSTFRIKGYWGSDWLLWPPSGWWTFLVGSLQRAEHSSLSPYEHMCSAAASVSAGNWDPQFYGSWGPVWHVWSRWILLAHGFPDYT